MVEQERGNLMKKQGTRNGVVGYERRRERDDVCSLSV